MLNGYIQKDVRHKFLRMSMRRKLNISGSDIPEMPTRYVEELRKEQSSKVILQAKDEIIAVCWL